jgi:hypothetical protein
MNTEQSADKTEFIPNIIGIETINGIRFDCRLVPEGGYEIFFPGIVLGGREDIADQVLRIGEDGNQAVRVFEFAKDNAGSCKDVYELYIKTADYIRKLDK